MPNTSPRTKLLRRVTMWIPVLVIAGWIVNINLPKPAFEITPTAELTRVSGNVEQESETAGQKTTDSIQEKEGANDKPATLPFDVNVVYSPGYLIDLGGLEKLHPFDIKKYEKIHNALLADKLLTEEQTFKPAPLEKEDLLLIHGEKYLASLQDRAKLARYLEANALVFAPVSLDKAVLQPFRRASGGTLLAGQLALKTGIGVNIGGGYHHAKPDSGEGFCVYADVPIAIRKLQKSGFIKTAIIIDVDVHQGNGTVVCLEDDDTTFTFSMHQEGIYPMPKEDGDWDVELEAGMGDEEYLKILNDHLPKLFEESKPDICFIVGGCDPLAGDPLASLKMTLGGIVKRDHAIVEACSKRNIPVVLTLSGGYSANAWKSQYMSIKNLIEKYDLAKKKTK